MILYRHIRYQRKASFDLKLRSHEKCDNRNVDFISSNIWKWSFGIPGFQLMDYFSYHFHYFLSFSLFLIILWLERTCLYNSCWRRVAGERNVLWAVLIVWVKPILAFHKKLWEMLKLFIITQLSERASGTCITFVKLSTGTPRSKSTEINVSLFNVPQRVPKTVDAKYVHFFAPTPRSPFNPWSGNLGTYSY